ncbi:MAG: exodeoxyribonuclease VII large subunit [Prevotella sp.]|jgi:exodeoxyribonuclease VII large subunit
MNKTSHRPLTLFELNGLVREVIELSLNQSYWVEAEISEVREVRGHCFMQLVENDPFQQTPIAKADAKCWANKWKLLRPKFEHVTGQTLHAGMKVLLSVTAQFHEAYGFSWIIDDIDPTFTLGDMARRRAEIIAKLKEEGVFDMQKELSLPMMAQRIAVISSEGAAGYGDFCAQLRENTYGLQFHTTLFPATMQGEQVESSVILALNLINERQDEFDVVVIIRGGGATSDLSGFDTLALAENVANFPLPILTGIGHQRDESILDMVAYQSLKTPTAVAAFLVDHLSSVYEHLLQLEDSITRLARQRLEIETIRFNHLAEKIPMLFSIVKNSQLQRIERLKILLGHHARVIIDSNNNRITTLQASLSPMVRNLVLTQTHRLEILTEKLKMHDPQQMLSKGFSITTLDGRILKDASTLHPGKTVTTQLEKGKFNSQVI